MKIKGFAVDTKDEVLRKLLREVLQLFKVEVAPDEGETEVVVTHRVTEETPLAVEMEVVFRQWGALQTLRRRRAAHADENRPAAIRRLFKYNLYEIFREKLGAQSAPWGILHGVRPTKIVHKYIDRGMESAQMTAKLEGDYGLRADKAALLVEVAQRQRPFLAQCAPRKVGVYIGIPFCLSRCLYCSFPSYVLPKEETLRAFWAALRADIEAAAASVRRCGLSVESLYIGGGTPTSLPESLFAEFLAVARDSFVQPDTVEFTVEAGRPDSVTDAKIAAMLSAGVNRVSVNPQTMQEKTLQYIGRNHTPQAIIEMFGKFRRAGMRRINMDLILGLPGETAEAVKDTLEKIAGLHPDNITLHALALKRGSALKGALERHALPDAREASAMYEAAARRVRAMGMTPYYLYRQSYASGDLENVGYSLPGAACVYNVQIMEERQTVLGVGPAATTKVVSPDGGPLLASFHAKDLTTYLQHADRYIEKRARLLDGVYCREESER